MRARIRAAAVALVGALVASALALGVPVAAHAADDASISGTVTGGYIELGYGEAIAYRHVGPDWLEQTIAPIDEYGNYTIAGLPAGEYLVSFTEIGGNAPTDDGELRWWREWWNDWMDEAAAAAGGGSIVLTEGQQLTGVDADVDSVEGQYTWPEISGTAQGGKRLTATPGAWPAGTDLAYVWYADGIRFATTETGTVTLRAAQLGKQIAVEVWGVKPSAQGIIEIKDGNTTSRVKAGTLKTATPTISGKAKVGKKLTAKHGTWTSGTSFSYRWYASGKKITAATKSTLVLKKAQKGKKITVKVTGKKAGYTTVTKTSRATAKVKGR